MEYYTQCSAITGGAKQPDPPPLVWQHCKNVIGTQNMLMYFRSHIFYSRVDAPQANILKKAFAIKNL